ncbi:MAG TPA: hypothetical protein VM900_11980 [Sphingomonas sp.]|nr:hypothetical protein [Sphingomonas sp.]
MRFSHVALCVGAVTSAGWAQQRAKETIISDPAAANWVFDGKPKVKPVDAAGVPGGKALLVTVGAKGANPWDIQARMPLKQGVAVGDTITFGFYARAEKPDPGQDVAAVTVRLQRAAAPYDAALEGPLRIGKEWTFHCLTGVSTLALDGAAAEVSVQIAGDKHAIAFGPWMATRIPGGGAAGKTTLPCGKGIGA